MHSQSDWICSMLTESAVLHQCVTLIPLTHRKAGNNQRWASQVSLHALLLQGVWVCWAYVLIRLMDLVKCPVTRCSKACMTSGELAGLCEASPAQRPPQGPRQGH